MTRYRRSASILAAAALSARGGLPGPPGSCRESRTASGAIWAATPATRAPTPGSPKSTPTTSPTWKSPGSGALTTSDPASSTRREPHRCSSTACCTPSPASGGRWVAIDAATGEDAVDVSRARGRCATFARRARTSARESPMRRSTAGASSSSLRPPSSSGRWTPKPDSRSKAGASRSTFDTFSPNGVVDLNTAPGGRLGPVARVGTGRTTRTTAFPRNSGWSPRRRPRSWSTASSWCWSVTSRATTRPASRTCRATSWVSMPAPAKCCGSST